MKAFTILTAALLLTGFAAHSQVIGPGLSGINRIAMPGNSDSFIAASFSRPEVASLPVLGFSANVITAQGSPGWTTNQFVAGGTVVDSFYVIVTSGVKEGSYYTITGNNANTMTVDLEGGSLAGLASGNMLSVVPHWTLATFFAGGNAIHTSSTTSNRDTEVLFPSYNAPGINAGASRAFYLYGGTWREVGQGSANRDHVVIYPDSYVIVRHNVPQATEFISSGQVLSGKLITWLGVNAGGQRDNYLSLLRPVTMTLNSSNLFQSGAFSASPNPANRTDELLVFDNTLVQQNKAASAVYYYWNGAWRKVGAGAANFDTTPVFTPGSGFVIRKIASTNSPAWTNIPTY